MNKRVRVGNVYTFEPVMMDVLHPSIPGKLQKGDTVKVVNKKGCPKANTMGMCYVEKGGEFAGLVCCNSLKEIEKVA